MEQEINCLQTAYFVACEKVERKVRKTNEKSQIVQNYSMLAWRLATDFAKNEIPQYREHIGMQCFFNIADLTCLALKSIFGSFAFSPNLNKAFF